MIFRSVCRHVPRVAILLKSHMVDHGLRVSNLLTAFVPHEAPKRLRVAWKENQPIPRREYKRTEPERIQFSTDRQLNNNRTEFSQRLAFATNAIQSSGERMNGVIVDPWQP